jgi:hypothetical protein
VLGEIFALVLATGYVVSKRIPRFRAPRVFAELRHITTFTFSTPR